jgi:monovalent cation/proton antiporter MnhG/PhaG subunit
VAPLSARQLAVDVLVALGVGGQLLCALGFLLMRDVFDRLHYVAASTALPPFFIAAAVVVEEAWTQPGINALLVAVLLFLLGPAVTVATARAARMRRLGQVEPTEVERREAQV